MLSTKFMLQKSFFLFLLFLPFTLLFAQSKKGIYIINSSSKVPIEGATVHTHNHIFSALTDATGFADLRYLPDTKTLIVACLGYTPDTVNIASIINNSRPIATLYLKPTALNLADVSVSSSIRTATIDNSTFRAISAFDIQLHPIINSQEVMRIIPGMFIGQHQGGGKAEQMFMRGFDLDHGTDINISVDGLPVNMPSHAHGQGYADLHFLIPELIYQMNFNKGPYYADKGNFTTAGFAAFTTKNYLDKSFIKLEGGQFTSLRTVAGINLLQSNKDKNKRNQSLYIAGEAFYSNMYFTPAQPFNRFNGILKYHGNVSTNNVLTASLTAMSSVWKATGEVPNRAYTQNLVNWFGEIDSSQGGQTARYNATVALTTNLNNGGTISNQIYYSKYLFALYSNFTYFLFDSIHGDEILQKENRNIVGYSGNYTNLFALGKVKTTTTAGVQVRYDYVHNIQLEHTEKRVLLEHVELGNINEMNVAAYWSQRFFFSNKWDVTATVRADYFTNDYYDKLGAKNYFKATPIIAPKLDINYHLNDKTIFYWYSGKGFHSNDSRILMNSPGASILCPAWGADLGGIFKITDNLMVQSAFWYLWLSSELVYDGDVASFEPEGQTQRLGWDASIRYQFATYFFADVDVNIARPKFLGVPLSQSYVPLAPPFTSTGGLSYRRQTGLNASLRYRWMGNKPANEDNSAVAMGYCVFDATVHYAQKKWDIGVQVQNLLNTKWKETQFYYTTRLKNKAGVLQDPEEDISYTPGTPFNGRLYFTFMF